MTAANDDLKLLWFLPTSGDGHQLGTTVGARQVDFDYLREIAQAICRPILTAGFDNVPA